MMLECLLRWLTILGAVFLLCLAATVTTDVTVRWLTGRPIVGVLEIAEVALLSMTFLTLPYVHYLSKELNVDVLRSRATGVMGRSLSVLDVIASAAFFALLSVTATQDFLTAAERGYTGRGMIAIPTAMPLAIVAAGSLLTLVALLARHYRSHHVTADLKADSGESAARDSHGQ
jgi:TRAP-type C4-dicarboxylate transport system permease small subunit